MPKDKDEPDCLQKQGFFKETKYHLFLIGPPCFIHYKSDACLPKVNGARTALPVILGFACQKVCVLAWVLVHAEVLQI